MSNHIETGLEQLQSVDQLLPPISVVVCTRDRAVTLRRCLESLCSLSYPVYEVVVVDNVPCNDETLRVVTTTPFRYVRENRPGLDWARNRGADEACYEIIAYTDDDVEVDPSWLRGFANAFADPHVAVVTGQVLPAALETEAQQLFEAYSGMGKGIMPCQYQRTAMSSHALIAIHELGVGANMAFRRSILKGLGGFDTALDAGTPSGGGGDLDMFHRVLVAGLTLRYEPEAVVRHHHRREIEALRKQLFNNGQSFGVYLIKLWQSRSLERREVTLFALRWIGGWLIARLIKCLSGRLDFPLDLVWAELWGALHALWAYRATYTHDDIVRQNEIQHHPDNMFCEHEVQK